MRYCITVLVAMLTAWSATAVGQRRVPPRELRDAETAASCFDRFARGEALPPAPPPAPARRLPPLATDQLRLLEALNASAGTSGADPDAENRGRLAHCVPRSAGAAHRVTRPQARWLSTCFGSVGTHLRSARGPDAVARVRAERDACAAVSHAMATWDPAEGYLTSGRPAALPGVWLQAVMQSPNIGHERSLIALEEAGGSLATCRETHGDGEVRVAAESSSEGWSIYAWAVDDEGSTLVDCVAAALRGARQPDGESQSVVFDVRLRTPGG